MQLRPNAPVQLAKPAHIQRVVDIPSVRAAAAFVHQFLVSQQLQVIRNQVDRLADGRRNLLHAQIAVCQHGQDLPPYVVGQELEQVGRHFQMHSIHGSSIHDLTFTFKVG